MRPLYDIDQDLMDCFDPDTGEILDDEKFEALSIERDEKIEGVALAIKNLTAELEAYDTEMKSFKSKMNTTKKKIEGLTAFLRRATQETNFHTVRVDVRFRRNPVSVKIEDDAEIPKEYYLPVKIPDPQPDKKAIKEALSEGIEIKGCSLVQNVSMSVK